MAAIGPARSLDVVKGIEAAALVRTAGRVLQRVKAVYRYALVHERIESNPMLDLRPAEILKPRQVKHRAYETSTPFWPSSTPTAAGLDDVCAAPAC
ncbi:MAG: hypothetical protein U1F67_12925 [Rubrivivax sp.]